MRFGQTLALLEISFAIQHREERGEFIVENFDDLLSGRDAAQNLFAEGFFFDPRDEILGDFEMHIGLE